jgi:hypothetical protein
MGPGRPRRVAHSLLRFVQLLLQNTVQYGLLTQVKATHIRDRLYGYGVIGLGFRIL